MPACQQYAVFGAIRSQSGSSPNEWLFTGEQRDSDDYTYDAAPSTHGIQTIGWGAGAVGKLRS